MDADKQITARVEDILKNHDQEIRTIEAQIEVERAALEKDLEEIRSRAYTGGQRFDAVRVQQSINPEQRMLKIVAALEARTKRTDRTIEALEERRSQIESVHHNILSLDAKSKCVLLTLYYPRRTYEEAAEILHYDRSTVGKIRKDAVHKLVKRIKQMK